MKTASRGGTAAVLGGAVALSLAIASPASAAADWQLDHRHDGTETSTLNDVDGTGADDTWAVGNVSPVDGDSYRPLVLRHDGTSWRTVDGPDANVELTGVDAVSSTSAWFVGTPFDGDSSVLRWNDGTWTTQRFAGAQGGDVAAVADDDVWYLEGRTARHWDGTAWSETVMPGDGPEISSVTALATDDVWAVGDGDAQPYAAHWDGAQWQEVSPPEVTPPPGAEEFDARLHSVTSTADGALWAAGGWTTDNGDAQPLLYRYDGSAWTKVKSPVSDGDSPMIETIGADADGELWLAPGDWDDLYRRTGDGWEKAPLPDTDGTASQVRAIGTSGGRTWAVGDASTSDAEFGAMIYRG